MFNVDRQKALYNPVCTSFECQLNHIQNSTSGSFRSNDFYFICFNGIQLGEVKNEEATHGDPEVVYLRNAVLKFHDGEIEFRDVSTISCSVLPFPYYLLNQ